MTAAVLVAAKPSAEDRIRAALWFADRDFGVFSCWSTRADGTCRCPTGRTCTSAGKHPVTAHGFEDATRDPERIRTLLSAGSSPNYGLVPPEGVFIWDVDSDEERARLTALEARYGPLPFTLRTDTSNGQHVFLRWPQGHPRPLRKMFGLVTRWGSGRAVGYVIGPRSIHASGKEYTPSGVFEIATLPEAWAVAALEPDTTSETLTISGPMPPEQVQVGGRHDWLRDRARFYAGTIRDPAVLLSAMLAENDRLPQPKLREDVERAIGEVLERFPADPIEADPDTGELRRVVDDEIGMLAPAAAGAFPVPASVLAYGGLLGECTLALAEGTDAALIALLGSVLAFSAALIPGQAYQHRMQTTSPYIALVGESTFGRKGTAMWRAHDAMSDALEAVHVNRVVLDGLNSGEGLISALAYKQSAFPYEPTVGLVFEEEYASLIASRSREGSTLDPKMRSAFDGGPLSNRRSSETKTVSPPYWLPALIGITPTELRRRLEPGALENGSANRWLYLPVRRREAIVRSGMPVFPDEHRESLQAARHWALEKRPILAVDPDVTRTISAYQDHLSSVSSGAALDLTRRLPITAFRLALIHAMAERSTSVTMAHFDRSLAVTEYARSGIDWIFGGTVGNRDADLLLRHLRKAGSLRKRTIEKEIVRDPVRRQDAIDELVRLGYAAVARVQHTGGRPRDELQLSLMGAPLVRFATHPPNGSVLEMAFAPKKPLTVSPPASPETAAKAISSTDGAGQKYSRSMAEGWQNGQNDDLVDASPGEVAETTTAVWAKPCSDYRTHQDDHRDRPGGWVCIACWPEEAT